MLCWNSAEAFKKQISDQQSEIKKLNAKLEENAKLKWQAEEKRAAMEQEFKSLQHAIWLCDFLMKEREEHAAMKQEIKSLRAELEGKERLEKQVEEERISIERSHVDETTPEMKNRVQIEKDQILKAIEVFFQIQDLQFMETLLKRHAKQKKDKLCSKDEFAAALADIGVMTSMEEAEVAFNSADDIGSGEIDVKQLMAAAKWPKMAEEWFSNLPFALLLSRCLPLKCANSLKELATLNENEVITIVELFSCGFKRLVQENIEQLRICLQTKENVQSSGASSKFETFIMSTGSVEDFHAGLGGRVGAPNPDLEKGIKTEHCDKKGCDVTFETSNYGIITTPRDEYLIAIGEAECSEAQLKDKMGRLVRIVQKKEVLMQKEIVTKALLWWLEVLSVVLYTGPMFQVYNTILRRYPTKVFEEFKDNMYATTIHVLVSAVAKIARSARMPTGLVLYRGLGGLSQLPERFYKSDQHGCRGYMEWGMLSTTSDKHAALEYSGVRRGLSAPMLLQIKTSSVDRPACIMELSQYPGEREYLFSPCAFLEPVRVQHDLEVVEDKEGKPEGVVEIVFARINANLKVLTVEELLERKKALHMDTFRFGLQDAGRAFDRLSDLAEARLAKDATRDKCSLEDFRVCVMGRAEAVLKRHEKLAPENYTSDEVYRFLVMEMLKTKDAVVASLEYYLEDPSQYLAVLKHRRIFDHLRGYHAFLWRTLPSDPEERRSQAARLSRGLGILMGAPNELDGDGLTPLTRAAVEGVGFRGLACLIWAGADVNYTDSGGTTAVWMAAEFGYGHVIQDLAALGADMNQADCVDVTPTFAAARNGHADAIKALSTHGAQINQADSDGWTPMYVAASNGHAEAVMALCSAGADANQADKDGRTPMYTAAVKGRLNVIKALCSFNANLNQAEKTGLTPLRIAKQRGYHDVVEFLLSSGAVE